MGIINSTTIQTQTEKKHARQWDEYEATEFMGSSQKETDSLGCE